MATSSKLLRIFNPDYVYHLDMSLVDLHFTDERRAKIEELGGQLMDCNTNGYKFEIDTSSLLRRLRFGRSCVTVVYSNDELNNDVFKVSVEFTSQRQGMFAFNTIFSLLVLLSIAINKDSIVKGFASLLLLWPCGHVFFWGSLIPNATRIREFFIALGD